MTVDLSPAAVEARLRECSRLSPLTLGWVRPTDMSPRALDERLRECSDLSRVCRELGRTAACVSGPITPPATALKQP